MPRLLNALGFMAFVLGAMAIAIALYLLAAGYGGLNPFGARPLAPAPLALAGAFLAGMVLMALGGLLARASARAEWQRELRAVAP